VKGPTDELLSNPWHIAFGKAQMDLVVDGELSYDAGSRTYRLAKLRFKGTLEDLYDWNLELEANGTAVGFVPAPQVQAGFLTFGERESGGVYRHRVELDAEILDPAEELRWSHSFRVRD
jgi:hypothetical protein